MHRPTQTTVEYCLANRECNCTSIVSLVSAFTLTVRSFPGAGESGLSSIDLMWTIGSSSLSGHDNSQIRPDDKGQDGDIPHVLYFQRGSWTKLSLKRTAWLSRGEPKERAESERVARTRGADTRIMGWTKNPYGWHITLVTASQITPLFSNDEAWCSVSQIFQDILPSDADAPVSVLHKTKP